MWIDIRCTLYAVRCAPYPVFCQEKENYCDTNYKCVCGVRSFQYHDGSERVL